MNRSRLLGVLVAMLALVGGLTVAPTPASADGPYCNYDSTFNACFWLNYNGYLWWNPYVGLDVHLDQSYAQAIVDYSSGSFTATLWADGDKITDLVLQPGWPAAGPTGLGVEFGLPNLNNSALAGHTAVYATISYFDSNSRRTQRFRTGTLNGYFGA